MKPRIRFSKTELKQLFISWTLISLAFAMVLTPDYSLGSLILSTLISLFTVGIGFIFHELSHKFVAQYYGCFAEFRSNMQMLIFALVTAFFGFVYAAPGAVVIFGHVSNSEHGKISLAGPAANFIVALGFFVLRLLVPSSLIRIVFGYGAYINSFLAVFNLIPFGNMDGVKVFKWNKVVYFSVMALSGLLLVMNYIL
ncbi:hypothetical protein JW930_03045 [Candidatus Woesearchaeota archaeon]|nr:hypothetical protein [Candidatus Woesearchaeota archaeon]